MPQIFVLPRQVALDDDASPMAGALAYFYATGTTTLQAIYADIDLTTPHANPLQADSAGRFPKAYYDSNAAANYRIRVTTAAGEQIYQEDDIDRFTVSVAEIARAFYPRSQAEIAASITPTDYRYPEANALRYGTNSNPGTTNMTAAIQAAIDVAAIGTNPNSGNNKAYIPKGVYYVDSLDLPDYVALQGAGRFQTILTGALTSASYIRSQHGEAPSIGQRPTGIDLADFSIQNASISAGSIGINLKNSQYCSVRRVLVKNVDVGAVTNQITQYTTWEEFIVQVANIGASFESTGGGNELFACHIAGFDTALDIVSGTWDISCTTAESLADDTAYCVHLGRAGGPNTTVHAHGLYVEGTNVATITMRVEDSVTRSAIRMHRHNTLGTIVNNAGTNCVIEVPGSGYYNPLYRVQRVELSATIDGSAQASLRSNGSGVIEARNAANDGYADWYLRTPYLTGTQTLTGAGAVDTTNPITYLVTTGANALTLANGTEGQIKYIVMITDGGNGTLTPTNFYNGSTITFDDVGDSAHLIFTNSRWVWMGGTATRA